MPKGLPPNAMRADSPPDEPPDVTLRLMGFTVRPKVLFTDSAYIASAHRELIKSCIRTIIIAVGTLVLQYRTAPNDSRMSTRVALYSAGSFTNEVKPTVLSFPLMLKLSFSEMGKPWSGPTTWPVRLRCSSRAFALFMASSKKTSLRQLVYTDISYDLSTDLCLHTNCCAAAARLQNARVTVSELHALEASFSSSCDAVLSVISSSSFENHPELFGHVVTSSCDSCGNCCSGIRYSCGMDSARDARFAAATFSHLLSDVIAEVHTKIGRKRALQDRYI